MIALIDQRLDLGGQPDPLGHRPGLRMLQSEGLRIPSEHIGPPLVGRGLVAGRGLVDGKVSGRHEGVRMIVSEFDPTASKEVIAELKRLPEPATGC